MADAFTIDRHTLDELQFEDVLSELQSLCFSPEGRGVFSDPEYLIDSHQLEVSRSLIAEILRVFSLKDRLSVAHIEPIDQTVKLSAKSGAVLEALQLWDLLVYAETVSGLPRHFLIEEEPQPRLEEVLGDMPDLAVLISALREYLVDPGEVREDHPRIRRLTEAVRRLKEERSRLISGYMQTSEAHLQANQAAVRDGRLVLPVKSRDKQQLPGIMHASSQSGNTLFIEPYDLVEKNNAVALAQQQVAIEVEKILFELTELTAGFASEIEELRATAAGFDRYYAMARYAAEHSCTRPETSLHEVEIRQARHPLLRQKAVPVDVTVDEKTRVIVMSGPNAGGKTVTLKTVGFLALMNQLGMYLPVAEGTRLPVFSSLWSDIGDEQSIELELSTFSGHLQRISTILARADERSLIILDELGTGTDPVEGAALAQSVLEYCRKRTSLTLVTSHHAVLKQYAYTLEDVANASMDYDEDALSPTFTVVLGHPGESRAIDTAERLQMPEEIIVHARELLGDQMLDLSHMMKELQRREQELAGEEQQAARRKAELTEKARSLELQRLKQKQEALLLKNRDLSSLQKFIRESRSLLERTVRELREQGRLSKEQIADAQQMIRGFEERAEEVSTEIEEAGQELQPLEGREADPRSGVPLSPGDRVRITDNRQAGRLVRREKRESWLVNLDNGMRLTVKEAQLKREELSRNEKQVQVQVDSFDQQVRSTIDVRGMTLAEALEVTQRQIDAALLSGLSQFSIIHGKGEGILQTGISEYLASHQSVTSFSFARPEDGGYGKTLVEL